MLNHTPIRVCAHEKFESKVHIERVKDRVDGIVLGYVVGVVVKCADPPDGCSRMMQFKPEGFQLGQDGYVLRCRMDVGVTEPEMNQHG